MGIKDYTCDKHMGMRHMGNIESVYWTPETNTTLYVNYTKIKMKLKLKTLTI